MKGTLGVIALGIFGGLAVDLLGAWIWLSYIHDGTDFPY